MEYYRLRIVTTEEGVDIIPAMLTDFDITGIEIEDPREVEALRGGKKTYHWDYVDDKVFDIDDYAVIVYTDDPGKAADIAGAFRDNSMVKELIVEHADDSEWKDRWKEFFKTSKITDRIVIKPGWEEYDPGPDELVIDIDPGTAFGTGTHETTSGCIELLERYMKKGDSVLDVGSGSGILSIASVLLGAGRVTAVDIDPEAVRVTAENAERNGMADSIETICGDLTKDIDDKYDIVVANLMADLVIMLSEDAAKHLNDGGIFISSGILIEKEEEVISALERNAFRVIEAVEKGEWCAIAAEL